MKAIKKGIVAAAVLGASALVASAAQASDGTITITGEVTAQTCTINGAADPADIPVTLPTVQTTAFQAVGDVAGRTGFNMNLTNCTPASGNVFAFFEQGPTIDSTTGNLTNQAGGGSNVQVQFVNAADGTAIDMSQPVGSQNVTNVPISAAGNATLAYAAQYKAALALATPGLVNTQVVYSLHYN